MKHIAPSSEDEMLLMFLREEIESTRFGNELAEIMEKLHASPDLIQNADLLDPGECAMRREIMGEYRGYGRDAELFERFPRDIQWSWYETEPEDLRKIFYIRYSYWDVISNGTSMPLEAVPFIRSGRELWDTPNEQYLSAERFLRNGGKLPPMMVLTADRERYVMVEGHLRITAYALAPETFPGNRILVGETSPESMLYWTTDPDTEE